MLSEEIYFLLHWYFLQDLLMSFAFEESADEPE